MTPLASNDQKAVDTELLSLAFSLTSTPGSYAVVLGAGISIGSGVPSAWDVLQDLLSQLAVVKDATCATDDERMAWYRNEYAQEPTYERVLEHLAPLPHDRQSLLRGYFEATPDEKEEGKKQPTAAHHAIARLVAAGAINVVITLNFDNLMEAALREQSVTPVVIRGQNDLAGLPPLHTGKPVVVHLHGDYLAPEEMRNTESELDRYTPEADAFLDRIAQDYGLLIVGWSARYDPQLRAAIKRNFRRIYLPYWVEPGTFTDEGAELSEQIGAARIAASADQALGELYNAYAALRERAATRHPLTAATLVSTAKLELSGRYTAIPLHDLLKREADGLHQNDDLLLSYTGALSPNGAYDGMRSRLEEASAALMSVMAATAYWGNEMSDHWVLREIQNFSDAPRASGLTVVLDLHNLVMMRLFYATGIAALTAGRYDTVRQLFTLEGDHQGKYHEYAVQVLEPAYICEDPSASHRLYQELKPLFVEHLSIGEKTYQDKWQVFEILRNLAAAAARPEAAAYLAGLTESARLLEEANKTYEEWLLQHPMEAAKTQEERAEQFAAHEPVALAKEGYGKALDLYSSLIPMRIPHLKAVQVEAADYESPIVRRLIREVSGSGNGHPLLSSRILTGSPDDFVQTLHAVNRAIQRERARRPLLNRIGVLPGEVWVDAGA
ncbi:SIR2 family protein [Arthrobacter ramosus]|uniref:SIR2 family protein n=1 Tax=Arthrobacter ramosus TaxID=1672 RepID=A0ABV5XWR7_ARTRM|nr:SIR2 family protein [Arthrobacter ramosus]